MIHLSRDTIIQVLRLWVIAVLLTVTLVTISSFALAINNSTNTTITSPVCAQSATENALADLTISSVATVFAAGLLGGLQSLYFGHTGLFSKLDAG
jgi:hypothetical protein